MNKRKHQEISDAEEAAIQRGIAADPDADEIPDADIKAMRPFSELLEKERTHRPPDVGPKAGG
jgi:hypothetical protein